MFHRLNNYLDLFILYIDDIESIFDVSQGKALDVIEQLRKQCVLNKDNILDEKYKVNLKFFQENIKYFILPSSVEYIFI